jgi:Tol biopolymer transport system component
MRALLATGLVLVVLAAGVAAALVIASRDGGDDGKLGLTPDLSGVSTAAPTATPNRTPPAAPTPMPTPDSNRSGPETTLVEVATGRTVLLGDQNNILIRFRFTKDGRWLIYDKGPGLGPEGASVYRLDLTSTSLQQERLTDGYYPRPSPDGRFIVFTRQGTSRSSLTWSSVISRETSARSG